MIEVMNEKRVLGWQKANVTRIGFLALAAVVLMQVSAAGSTFVVSNLNDSGPGSLRQAILDANAKTGLDNINFNITGTGPHTIQPTSALPSITDPVIIDGTTQPGFSSKPIVELDGSNTGTGSIGLEITGGNSTVRGLVINRFNGSSQSSAIELNGSGGNVIEGNYIGTDVTGTTALTNAKLISVSYPGFGIVIYSSSGNTIGGTAPGSGNLISGNQRGIVIEGASATGNLVQGNYIGTDVTGTVALGNGWWQDYYGTVMYFGSYGVFVHASNNTIGGTSAGARNIISGNKTGIGIYASDNIVQGNYIGTDKTGTAALGNSVNGISIKSYGQSLVGNIIGGTTADARNIISGNGQEPGLDDYEAAAVYISISGGLNASGTIVQGNYIGTDETGLVALANKIGVKVANWDSYGGNFGITIGGATAGSRNIISGNTSHGISIVGLVSTTTVQGNYIGTDVTGSMSLGNSSGIVLIPDVSAVGPTNNTIGGTTVGTSNVISGNQKYGIYIAGNANQVQGNFIGTDAAGAVALANGLDGVAIVNAADNTIGGTVSGAGNTIAFNGSAGVIVSSGTGNTILLNAMFSNTHLGIDLGNDGVTPNDPGDSDTGANNLQNFPEIAAASSNGINTTISGTLNSTPGTTFIINLYSNNTGDPSGYGEGGVHIGTTTSTTDSSGSGTWTLTVGGNLTGPTLSSTATDPSGNTSEFSALHAVEHENNPPTADAGAEQILDLESSTGTEVTLDGSGSTDPDSTEGTNDDIASFDWYEGAVHLGNGEILAYTFALGEHAVTLFVTDSFGRMDDDQVNIVIEDTIPPEVEIIIPDAGLALQDAVTLTAEAFDFGGVAQVYFYIREAQNPSNSIGYEDLAATYNSTSDQWEYSFDTTQLPDGYYIILAMAVDNSGNEGWSEVVASSIRNWAIIELLPASESNKAGRTMPVKFSLRIAESVDPEMPFVYNEGLEIRIYDQAEPETILQSSFFGVQSTDYRIGGHYITNFKTKKQPAIYKVEIWRTSNIFKVGSFTFETVK